MFIRKSYNFFLDIFFPKYCLGCGREGIYLCEKCSAGIGAMSGAACYVCNRRSPDGRVCRRCRQKSRPALSGLLVCGEWKNLLLRQTIYEYKYRFVNSLSEPLARLMMEFLENSRFKNFSTDNLKTYELILVPLPLHPRRLAWRGFNQAELLAKKISERFGWPLNNNLLRRSCFSPPQREMKDEKHRRQNIAGVFSLNEKNIQEKNFYHDKIFILVDDVSTTGATLEEAARVLKQLKPKEIWGLVIARG